jgi:hypothetical protein
VDEADIKGHLASQMYQQAADQDQLRSDFETEYPVREYCPEDLVNGEYRLPCGRPLSFDGKPTRPDRIRTQTDLPSFAGLDWRRDLIAESGLGYTLHHVPSCCFSMKTLYPFTRGFPAYSSCPVVLGREASFRILKLTELNIDLYRPHYGKMSASCMLL